MNNARTRARESSASRPVRVLVAAFTRPRVNNGRIPRRLRPGRHVRLGPYYAEMLCRRRVFGLRSERIFYRVRSEMRFVIFT